MQGPTPNWPVGEETWCSHEGGQVFPQRSILFSSASWTLNSDMSPPPPPGSIHPYCQGGPENKDEHCPHAGDRSQAQVLASLVISSSPNPCLFCEDGGIPLSVHVTWDAQTSSLTSLSPTLALPNQGLHPPGTVIGPVINT